MVDETSGGVPLWPVTVSIPTDAPNPVTIPGADLAELIATIGPVVDQLSDRNNCMFFLRGSDAEEQARYIDAMAPVIRLRAALAKLKGDAG